MGRPTQSGPGRRRGAGPGALPASDMPGNPELLGGRHERPPCTIWPQISIVIIDAPPVCRFTDAVVLAEYAGGVLLVARAGRTSAEELREPPLWDRGGGHILAWCHQRVRFAVMAPRSPSLMRRVPPSDPSFLNAARAQR